MLSFIIMSESEDGQIKVIKERLMNVYQGYH